VTEPLIAVGDLTVTADDQVALASARVRAYCKWHVFPSITETLTLDGPGQAFLMLPSMYVTDLASITEDGALVDPGYYEWSESGQVWRAGCWTGHFRALAVELTHGYDVVPDAVRDVVLAVASRLPAGLSSVAQESVGGVSRLYGGILGGQAALNETFTAAERMELAAYRLPPRA
jgi:hypothetical protein